MINHLWRRMADHLPGGNRIIVQFNSVQPPGFPGFRHRTAFHNMQRMQLNTVNTRLHHTFHGLQAFCLPFSRQTDNQVRTDFQPAFTRQSRGVLVAGKIMTAVNTVQGFVMCGLQTKFQPYLITQVFILAKQIEYRIRHAVGARPNA